MKTFYEIMQKFELPIEYGYIRREDEKIEAPFLIYISTSSDRFYADDLEYNKKRNYRVEYYFEEKNEELEDRLEKYFLENNFIFSNSDDVYIDGENLFVIYYEVETSW